MAYLHNTNYYMRCMGHHHRMYCRRIAMALYTDICEIQSFYYNTSSDNTVHNIAHRIVVVGQNNRKFIAVSTRHYRHIKLNTIKVIFLYIIMSSEVEEQYQQNLDEDEDYVEYLENEISSSADALARESEEHKIAQKKNEKLAARISSLEEEMKSQQKDAEQHIGKLETKIEEDRQTMEITNRQLETLRVSKQKVDELLEQRNNRIKEIEETMASQQGTDEQIISELERQLNDEIEKNKDTQADIAKLKESVNVCQKQSEKFKTLLTGKRIASEQRKAKIAAVIAARKNIREYSHKSSLKF